MKQKTVQLDGYVIFCCFSVVMWASSIPGLIVRKGNCNIYFQELVKESQLELIVFVNGVSIP